MCKTLANTPPETFQKPPKYKPGPPPEASEEDVASSRRLKAEVMMPVPSCDTHGRTKKEFQIQEKRDPNPILVGMARATDWRSIRTPQNAAQSVSKMIKNKTAKESARRFCKFSKFLTKNPKRDERHSKCNSFNFIVFYCVFYTSCTLNACDIFDVHALLEKMFFYPETTI